MNTGTRRAGLALALVLPAGCAGVPQDAGFAEVREVAATRLGVADLRWNRGSDFDLDADAVVARLVEAPLTMESAVRIALLNNARLQADFESLGVARAELVQAGLLENPTVSADILFHGSVVSPEVGIVQNVLHILTMPARSAVASAAFEGAKLEAGRKVLDLAAEVRSSYYRLVGHQQAVELFRQVVSATEAAAELSFRQREAGNVSARDQALQQAQYAQAALDLARLELDLAAERERMNRLLGLWGDRTAWNLPDRLPDLPAEKPSIEGLETYAIERRLDLAGARQEAVAARTAAELARQLGWLSALGLGVKFERDGESGRWAKGPTIEFGLPIFDWGQARVAQMEAQERRSEKLYAALATDVRAEVREAWVRLVAAHDAVGFYRATVLPLRQRVLDESTRLSNAMIIGVFDLLRARQDQIDAAREYIGAIKEYWIARAALENALGAPLPSATTATSMRNGT